MDEIKRLADRLRMARETSGMTVVQAAEAVGVDPESIEAYESAERQPHVLTFRRLAVAYARSADWLLG